MPQRRLSSISRSKRPDWNARQRALTARLSEGAVGRARSFDLPAYSAARTHALAVLNSALGAGEHSELFKITETYRAGAEGRDKTDRLLRALYSLLQDITFLHSGTPELVRNTPLFRAAGHCDATGKAKVLRKGDGFLTFTA